MGIRDLLFRKLLHFIVGQEHGVDVLAYDHAGRSLIRKLRVEREADRFEERHRLVEVLDGEIDEDLVDHFGNLPWVESHLS